MFLKTYALTWFIINLSHEESLKKMACFLVNPRLYTYRAGEGEKQFSYRKSKT